MRARIRRMLPYDVGAPLLATLWSRRPVQRVALWRLRQRYPHHPFYRDASQQEPERLQRHLSAHTFRKWRELALDRCSDRSFARWTRFRGTEHVEAALAQGRGLILAGSHHGTAWALKILLARHGLDVVTLGSGREQQECRHGRVLRIGDKESEEDLLRSMVELRRELKRGGIVHVPADSRGVGRSGVELDFLGRRRRFAHGFAVLALTTRAPVVPVFAVPEPDGRITVEFHPALPVPLQGSRGERLRGLVSAYAACLERRCLEQPELTQPRYSSWLARQESASDAPKPKEPAPRRAAPG